MSRPPNRIIGSRYMKRWYLIPRNRWLNVYLHRFDGPDEGAHLHDHPWWNLSILLSGCYTEVRQGGGLHRVGRVALRRPEAAHRIHQISGRACWTLFITGPRVREWGFYTENGWVPAHEYIRQSVG
ncbi:MAG: hypothetical protein ACNA7W_17735 [Pseudomonadales bacterium]